MKKILICLLSFNFMTFFFYASSAEPVAADTGSGDVMSSQPYTVTELLENSELENQEQVLVTPPEIPEIWEKKPAENNIEPENITADIPEYPALGDIKEPEVITLEPENEETIEELVQIDIPAFSDSTEKNENAEKPAEADTEKKAEKKQPATEIKESQPETEQVVEKTEKPDEKIQEKTETVSEETIEQEGSIITPSRSVTVKQREYLDITYPGTGWIYTGITDGSKDHLSYFGHNRDTSDTTFILQAKKPGKKILHFCKNDYLTGEYIDDYIEVIILQEQGSNKTHIKAPEYVHPGPEFTAELENDNETSMETKEDSGYCEEKADIAENKLPDGKPAQNHPEKNETAEISGKTDTVENITNPAEKDDTMKIQEGLYKPDTENYNDDFAIDIEDDGISIPEETVVETSENSDVTDLNTLLKEADFLYNEKEFAAAYEKVNTYLQFAVTGIDDGLLLKGKILEAKSDIQDIKGAIHVYNTLMKEYPASRHWDEANKRVIYLRRFYLEVR